MGRRLLCCWMLWLLILLTLTVIPRLISLDEAGMMLSLFILSGGLWRPQWRGLWLTAAR